MLHLIIGAADKTKAFIDAVDFTSPTLLIDDGPIIDALSIPKRRAVTIFNPARHTFNPLQGMDYRKARNFIAVLGTIFPEGENTLTKKNSNFVLLQALLANKGKKLDRLLEPSKDPAEQDAYQKIQTLMLSPVLNAVLTKAALFSFDGVVLARFNRVELGDDVAFVLAQFLISQFKGQVIVPDGGFYLKDFHLSLIRENRLTVGLNRLSEVSEKLQGALLQIPSKTISRTTYDDAVMLANQAGLGPDPTRTDNDYNNFIRRAVGDTGV